MAFYCNGKQGICDCDTLCADCKFYDDKGGKDVKTNADRIRAMSDEELYKFCLSLTDDGWPFACQNKPECDPVPPKPELCNECFMKWLQQPAEVE